MCRLRLLKISGRNLCLRHGPPAFPDTLRYLSWDSYPLKSISTNFIADKLVALDMRGSQLEKLWEGAPNLDNLKRIDLSESMQLTQAPDLSRAPNIESVNLCFCASLTEVPSYFQHLTKLKELSLRCCPSLATLSGLPRSLITLEVLTRPFLNPTPNSTSSFPSLNFASKLGRFPKISERMEFFEHLQLEFAAIKELPLSITNLTGLKALGLRFCQNLEFLPDSLHSLSSLQELDIGFCRKLESLPVLPSSLSILDATFCTSLKTVSSSIPLVKQNWDDLISRGYKYEEFRFFGCEMLDENARRVLMDEALFRILRYATLVSKYGADECISYLGFNRIYWPGSEIPRWFSHKSDESSICIKLPHPDRWYNNSSYLGLAFCLVLKFHDPMLTPDDWLLYGESVYIFPNGDSWKQRRNYCLFLSWRHYACFSGQCCGFDYDETTLEYVDGSLINSEYVCVFMDNTYGEFLRSNNGQIDSHGNKFPRTATVNFPEEHSGEFGEYIKTEEGRFNVANGITGFTTPTATASFSFHIKKKAQKLYAKIKKCGVHLLYRQEAARFGYRQEGARFGYVRQVDQSELSRDHEAIYSSDQDEKDEEEDDNSGGEFDSDEE